MKTDKVTDLSELVRCVNKGNATHRPNFLSSVLHLIAACADVNEPLQWRSPKRAGTWVCEHKKEFSTALGRVLYWILYISACMKVDVSKAFEEKLILIEKKYPVPKDQ